MPNWRLLAMLATLLAAGVAAFEIGSAHSGGVHDPFVAPPSGARVSAHEVAPFATVGSPYLHTSVATYAVPLAPQGVYSYYRPGLRVLGYHLSGQGTVSRYGTVLSRDWQFTRGAGMDDTVLLTVEPKGQGSLYSIARELIVAPPRPRASIVPQSVTKVVVTARSAAGRPWAIRTLRGPKAWREILAIVDALPVDTRGMHGCAADFGAAAKVVFETGRGTFTFTEDWACQSVSGPAGAHLQDESFRLWTTAAKQTGIPASPAAQ